ncbi:MAG: hypothetical protein C5B55_04805 [Blastocatellia bacterium]|nr:MAG: hypothetical protein C5B55_04805 [Blastocatellia bacterium]
MRYLSRVTSRPLILALSVAITASTAFGQLPTGSLLGRVHDSENRGLQNVEVRVTKRSTWPQHPSKITSSRQSSNGVQLASQAFTDRSGRFKLLGLSPGLYSMEISLSGWQSQGVSNLDVRANSSLDINVLLFPMSAGQRQQRISSLDGGLWLGGRFGAFSLHGLPTARRIWSILENQETSTVTDRVDVGGLDTGRIVLFGALGTSWTENRYKLNGFDVHDAYIPGRALTDPDFDSLADMTVVTAAKAPSFSGGGTEVDLTTQRSTNADASAQLKGAVRVFYSGGALQSDNMEARLSRIGFPGPERLNHLVDLTGQLSGELRPSQAKLPFFVALSTQQLSKTLGGFAAPIDVHVYHAVANVTAFSRGNKQLEIFYAGQHVFNSHQNADPRVAPSATERGNDNFHQFQARWSSSMTASRRWEVGFGVAHAIVSSGIQPGVVETSTIDLPELIRTGAAPLAFAGTQTRYQIRGTFQDVRQGFLGSHGINAGATYDRSNIRNRWVAVNGIEQVLTKATSAEVIRWNTPTQASQHVQNFSLFGQDEWRPAESFAVNFGLRMENSVGQADDATNRINWTTVEPRVGFVLPLPRRFVLRGGFARYGHVLQGRYLDFGNPVALGGEVLQWQDVNGDLHAQSSELTRTLRVFGGSHSAVDNNLRRPYTDEISVVLEKRIGERFIARAIFFRRDTRHLIEVVNTGVPFANYTPTLVRDPGNDGIIGTADDQRLTLFNRQPAALGEDFLLLTNPTGFRGSFKGFEIEAIKRIGRRWEATMGFTATHSTVPTNPGNQVFQNDPGSIIFDMSIFAALNADPNTRLFETGRMFFDRGLTGKLTGFYEAPLGLQIGAVAKYYDGLPFSRMLFVDGFNQGPFFVRATTRDDPGVFRTNLYSTVDLAIARAFALKHGEIFLHLDVFNLLNLSKATVQADLTSPTFELRVPLSIEAPRTFRLGFEWKF